jgi:hypothetical protein
VLVHTLAAADDLADRRLRPRDADVRDHRDPGAHDWRLGRRRVEWLELGALDLEERDVRLPVHALENGGTLDAVTEEHTHAAAGNGHARGSDDAVGSHRDGGSDQPAALARAAGGIRRGIADHGHDAGVNGVDDPEERSFVGAERNVARNRVGERGARPREDEHREPEEHRARGEAAWNQART